jgi:hypothetical protein
MANDMSVVAGTIDGTSKHCQGPSALSRRSQVVGTCQDGMQHDINRLVFNSCKMSSSLFSMIHRMASFILEQTTLFWIFAFAVSLLLFERSHFLRRPKSDIPRIGPAPGAPPSEDGGYIKNGIKYVQEGYEKVSPSPLGHFPGPLQEFILGVPQLDGD